MEDIYNAIEEQVTSLGGRCSWEDAISVVPYQYHPRLSAIFRALENDGRVRRVTRVNPEGGHPLFYVTTAPKPDDGIEVS